MFHNNSMIHTTGLKTALRIDRPSPPTLLSVSYANTYALATCFGCSSFRGSSSLTFFCSYAIFIFSCCFSSFRTYSFFSTSAPFYLLDNFFMYTFSSL